ncbi:hypothetical protein EDB80DRAFT_693741, partial [Ilyonectria destructans]
FGTARFGGSASWPRFFGAPFVCGTSSSSFSPETRALLLVPLLEILSGGSSLGASTLAFRLVDFLVGLVFAVSVAVAVATTSSTTLLAGAESLVTRAFAAGRPRPRPDFFTGSGSSAFSVLTLFDFRTN